ncbi:hypothetical protein A0H76_1048 [Hepatospora eriocheir]|uniref:Uncharacterized protein n=1 Tax=Hepatospora eriocheir TaxID=1081669 RepID=A0A1X0Q681_9MICR|nr:hypothetical protein A0H76_1048 [Hepatospora eriocheir]
MESYKILRTFSYCLIPSSVSPISISIKSYSSHVLLLTSTNVPNPALTNLEIKDPLEFFSNS